MSHPVRDNPSKRRVALLRSTAHHEEVRQTTLAFLGACSLHNPSWDPGSPSHSQMSHCSGCLAQPVPRNPQTWGPGRQMPCKPFGGALLQDSAGTNSSQKVKSRKNELLALTCLQPQGLSVTARGCLSPGQVLGPLPRSLLCSPTLLRGPRGAGSALTHKQRLISGQDHAQHSPWCAPVPARTFGIRCNFVSVC